MAATVLTRDDVFQRIRSAESRIRDLGVRRLALFGSVLRDEARPDSDVDLLVQFEPGEKSLDRFMSLYDLLEEIFDQRVELLTTESLSPYIGPHILAEATDVIGAS
jgi:predicted nucleotidyltransferase